MQASAQKPGRFLAFFFSRFFWVGELRFFSERSVFGKDCFRTGCFAYRSFGLDGTIPWLAFVHRYEGKCCVTELNKIPKPTLTKNAARNLGINLRQKMTKFF